MPIYTRTGDFGETSLFGGKRVLKCDDLVEFYGNIDELNSTLGLIVSLIEAIEAKEFLLNLQKDLFVIGSFFAGSDMDLKLIEKRVKEMEERIDAMDKSLPVLHKFIIPGGSSLASIIHIGRSIARKTERRVVYLYKNYPHLTQTQEKNIQKVIMYLNRLSDFLFILARFMNNKDHIVEIVWEKNK